MDNKSNLQKYKRLDELRVMWRSAEPVERKIIEQEAFVLKESLEFKYQCYFVDENGVQCSKRQQEHWCSDAHRIAWQEQNYGEKSKKQEERKFTIPEMQERLRKMGENRREPQNKSLL